jgi:hypothetical protein
MARQAQRSGEEVQEHDGVRGLQPDIDDVIGPEVPVHDPRLMCGELALDGCPLVAGVGVRPGRRLTRL